MARQDWRNQLASAYGKMQQNGTTSPSRQRRMDRRQAIRQQVNPGVRPQTGGLDPMPGPGPTKMPPQTMPPSIAPYTTAPQPRPMAPPTTGAPTTGAIMSSAAPSNYMPESAKQLGAPTMQTLSPYPDYNDGPVAPPPPAWNNPGIQGSEGQLPPSIATTGGSQPLNPQPQFSLTKPQPTQIGMPTQPGLKPGDASIGPVVPGGGAW